MSGFWTDEKNAQMRALFVQGESYSRIARMLGTTRSAVAGRVLRRHWRRDRNDARKGCREENDVCQANAAPATEPDTAIKTENTAGVSTGPARRADGAFATMLDVADGECRWPVGDPGAEDFHLCGAQAVPGKPYCACHCAVAYVPGKARGTSESAAYLAYLQGNRRGHPCGL